MDDKEYVLPVWAKYVTYDSLHPDVQMIADIIGLESTIKLMDKFFFVKFNIPRTCTLKYKQQYIVDNYNGTKESRMKLNKICNVPESYVYATMQKYRQRIKQGKKNMLD